MKIVAWMNDLMTKSKLTFYMLEMVQINKVVVKGKKSFHIYPVFVTFKCTVETSEC